MRSCAAYDAFDFKRVVRALSDFANVKLSAFYFDVRKDALYCDAPSSLRRRAALHVIRKLFESLVVWFAPMLPFTMEEAWLSKKPDAVSVHLEQFPTIPADWRNEALAAQWAKIRTVRSVVTGALEIERREKRIGSSLEAAPIVHISRYRTSRRAEGSGFRRDLHHLRPDDRRGRGPGRRLPAARCPQGRRRPDAGRGHEMRPLLAHHEGCRLRPGLPGLLGPRCGRTLASLGLQRRAG